MFVKEILDEKTLIVDNKELIEELSIENGDYKITPKLDQSELYSQVWSVLNDNRAIFIFPEGGSHDQPCLMEMKAGVCILGLGFSEKFDKDVSYVPVGLNYHKVKKNSKFRLIKKEDLLVCLVEKR